MKITITNPSSAIVEATPEELVKLRNNLTFTNTSIAHSIKRLHNNHWLRSKNEDKWANDIAALKSKLTRTLVSESDSVITIYPGSIPYLPFENVEIVNEIKYPPLKKVAWKKPLPFDLKHYQEESWPALIKEALANVCLCTGSGKSAIILKICREMGLRTAIIAPSKSIFNELLKKFEFHFGKDKVGTFGAGKKKLGKLFTICIGDSVCNIKQGTEEWEFFSTLQAICVDESHTWGAETLEDICFGVLKDVPYRFFFSGTQTRNDGTEKLLQSIIGKTVYTLPTSEAVRLGYICKHDYRIVNLESSNPNYTAQDALEMKRVHFLKNKNICAFIAKLANTEATTNRRQTLVLVEELEQISMLLSLLKVPVAYAHSEKKPQRLGELGLQKVDVDESVEKFNKNEVMVLVGTSCISIGTNIYPMRHTINWVGGSSEIKTKQGPIGRTVRLGSQNPWADKCLPKDVATIWDFNVYDVFVCTRHLEDRIEYYKESGTEIKTISIKK